ncbi:MAG: response regulator transcription factor [Salibacteraceae bacterium]|nr:response regulator transcription factor [Salibacteraceae bacterium]MDP4686581.1 response regulator transcription factor [Salibacteraceae bacterium]MDP4843269.1 response regulator transcription factor [Salibacteraceae bacterium]MDP4933898.1 response regulator transcription factor [Salibacteraceae bacterium]MDP4965301.1 response regulator transcription factor [Salibacteraceae bacterium]
MEPQNILLVDDHKIIREGIKHYLEGLDNVTVIGEAQNGQQALEWLKSNSKQVTIALLDIGMDGMNGIQLCEQILQLYPEIKCIALSMFSEPHHIKQMMQAGAKGYMLKNSTQEELKEALENVASGRNFFTSEVTNIVMSSMAGTNKKSYSKVSLEMPLTERELEVLELVMKEFTNNEIADELFISPRTVDAHKRNLLEKTGSKNLAGLVMYAVHHSLFDDLY